MTALLDTPQLKQDTPAIVGTGVATAPPGAPSSKPRRSRVLCVDDELLITSTLRRLLRNEELDVVTANTAAEALAVMEQQPADLIISDYRMPQMTGVQLLREVRKRWPHTLRIVLSGFTEINALIASVNEGEIYKFLSKPWDDTELKLHVRRALEQRTLVLENQRLMAELTARNNQLEQLNEQLAQLSEDARAGQCATQIMMEHLGVGVLVVDSDGLIVYANQWVGRYISYGAPDLIGTPAAVALPTVIRGAVFGPTADGQARVALNGHKLQCRCRTIPSGEGQVNRLTTIWEDVP
jgi:CheY-like chemotaxis protein